MSRASVGELSAIERVSGVNDRLEPFVTIRAVGTLDGRPVSLGGQLPPDEVRVDGMRALEVAAGADDDALIYAVLVEDAGLEVRQAAQLIGRLRQRREAGR